jgi:hypothetical protein
MHLTAVIDVRWKIFAFAVVIVTIAFSVVGYISASNALRNQENLMRGRGTIQFVDLEGGFYGIVSDDGKRYQPINIEQEYHLNGLRVYFEGEILEDTVSIYMWGRPLSLVKIRRLVDLGVPSPIPPSGSCDSCGRI